MKDKGLLEKYNTIWDIVSFHIKKEFYSKPVYNKKFYGDETADFHNKKMSNEGSDYISLAIINVDSTLKKKEDIEVFSLDLVTVMKNILKVNVAMHF